MKCTKFIEDLYKHKNQNEYSTHHEFSNSTTSFEDNDIQVICEFLCKFCDIFSEGNL